jgi:hypothetical protein
MVSQVFLVNICGKSRATAFMHFMISLLTFDGRYYIAFHRGLNFAFSKNKGFSPSEGNFYSQNFNSFELNRGIS